MINRIVNPLIVTFSEISTLIILLEGIQKKIQKKLFLTYTLFHTDTKS